MATVRVFRITLLLLAICSSYASAQSVTLAWDPNPDPQVTGYRVYYGTSSRSYTQSADAGNATTFVVSGLDTAKDHYFAVRAYDDSGTLSELSEEVTQPGVVTLGTTKISAFTVNRLPPYLPGTSVQWNAKATSTKGTVEYKFLMYSTTGGWTVAQDYGAASSFTWAPTFDDIGMHAIQVWARAVGSSAAYEAWVGGTFEVTSTPVQVVADTDFPVPPGQPVKWTATVAGANGPLEYRFLLLDREAGVWSELRPYGTTNQTIWTPGAAGTFALQVWARRVGSTAPYQVWGGTGVLTVSRSKLSIMSVTANVSLPAATGTPITWTARAQGGTAGPIEYAFYRFSKEKNEWQLARPYSPSPTFTWTPAWGEHGKYALQVWARNAGSTEAYDAWRGTEYFEITQPPVQLSADAAFPVPPGTRVTWTASVPGSTTGLEYAYFVYSRSTGTWARTQAYSTSNTFVWTPSAADTYLVQVWARRIGSSAPYELWYGTGYLPVTVTPAKIASLSSDISLPAAVGTPITWTAVGAGGTSAPLQYRFYLYTEGVGFKLLRDYSPSNSITWTPEAAGSYSIQVWVKSAYSLTTTYEGWKGTPMFVITP